MIPCFARLSVDTEYIFGQNTIMSYSAVGKKVIIQIIPDPAPEENKEGIEIPSVSLTKFQKGTILSVGQDVTSTSLIVEGNVARFLKGASYPIDTVEGATIVAISAEDIWFIES